MQKSFLTIALFVGITFSNLTIDINSVQAQSVNTVQQENVNRFWEWYQGLNEGDRIAANTFIKNFLLKENNLSENLNSFSINKSHALALSSFIEEAEQSKEMREILICAAYEGGSGCTPNSP